MCTWLKAAPQDGHEVSKPDCLIARRPETTSRSSSVHSVEDTVWILTQPVFDDDALSVFDLSHESNTHLFFWKSCNVLLRLSENRILSFLSGFTLLMSASVATAHKLETQLLFSATTSGSFHLVRETHYGRGAFFFGTTSIHIHLFIEVIHDTAATANG